MISAVDLLEINIIDIDHVLPAVKEIQSSLNSYPNLPANHESIVKINKWVDLLKQKNFDDQLSEDEVRGLKFDLDSAFSSFKN